MNPRGRVTIKHSSEVVNWIMERAMKKRTDEKKQSKAFEQPDNVQQLYGVS
jgi:hypothetical protein